MVDGPSGDHGADRASGSDLGERWSGDLDYLQSELGWVEARCHRLALERRLDSTLRSSRRAAFSFRTDERIEAHELPDLIDDARRVEEELREANDRAIAVHRERGPELAIDRMVRAYELDEVERTVLLLAVAPCVSQRYDVVYGGLDPEERERLTVDGILAFLELTASERVARRRSFGPRAKLIASDLVEVAYHRSMLPKDLLSAEVALRGRAFARLLGDRGLGDELADLADIEEPQATFDRVVIPERDKRRILDVIDHHEQHLAVRTAWGLDDTIRYGRGTVMLLHGPSGTGKTATAHAIAHRLGKRVLNVNGASLLVHEEAGRFLPALIREAAAQRAVVFFDEAECVFAGRQYGNSLMGVLLAEIERIKDGQLAILATNAPELLDPALERRLVVRVHLAEPDEGAREKIWRTLVPPAVPLGSDVDFAKLAAHRLTGGLIKNAILAAAARVVSASRDGGDLRLTHAALDEAAKDQAAQRVVPKPRTVGFERPT